MFSALILQYLTRKQQPSNSVARILRMTIAIQCTGVSLTKNDKTDQTKKNNIDITSHA